MAGKYGTLEAGSAFGEAAFLTGNNQRDATIIASKGSSDKDTITLYRLDGEVFRSKFDEKELKKLQHRIKEVYRVYDILSGQF